jgi:N-acetylneuraminic acid mutarotase
MADAHSHAREALAALLFLGACGGGSSPPAPPGCPSSCGSWSVVPTTASTPLPRFGGFAVVRHGLVHFMGGIVELNPLPKTAPNFSVDILDPATGTWSAGPAMPSDAPMNHMAAAVLNDAVYLVGGYDSATIATTAAYVLDDAGWHRIADAPVARQGAAAQVLGGKIYVAGGGTDETTPIADLYVYDPASNTWTAGPAMPTARSHVASCVLDGKMIVAGGFQGPLSNVETLAVVEEFDPGAGTWTRLPDLPTARGAPGAAVLGETCFVAGGFQWIGPSQAFAVVEGFDAARGAWGTFAPMAMTRHSAGFVSFNGTLVALGGSPVPFLGYSNEVEVFTP